MNKNKIVLIAGIVASSIFTILFAFILLLGIANENDDLIVAGTLTLIFCVPLFAWEIFSSIKKYKNNNSNPIVATASIKESVAKQNGLEDKYSSIGKDQYNEVGYVHFVNEGLKFESKGKYAYIEDFNGIKGYHLAFNIYGTKLVETPEGYDDVIDYETFLYNIDLGYFEDIILSTPENDNGVAIVKDLNTLEGKTIKITQDGGYIATIDTAEIDDIDLGEIEFVEWNEESKIIKFKFLISAGVCDIVAGTLKLTQDEE